MVLLSFPVVVPVEKNILPPLVATAIVLEPKTLLLVIVLFVASPTKDIVQVPEVDEVDRFEIVNEFPPEFKPLIVTLSAPDRDIKATATLPLIVLAPFGVMDKEVQFVELFKVVAPVSLVTSAVTSTETEPVCTVPVFKTENNPPASVNEEYPIGVLAEEPPVEVTIYAPVAGVQL